MVAGCLKLAVIENGESTLQLARQLSPTVDFEGVLDHWKQLHSLMCRSSNLVIHWCLTLTRSAWTLIMNGRTRNYRFSRSKTTIWGYRKINTKSTHTGYSKISKREAQNDLKLGKRKALGVYSTPDASYMSATIQPNWQHPTEFSVEIQKLQQFISS